MKSARGFIACLLLALTAFGAVGCVTTRGRGPHPNPRYEKEEPHKKPPHPHK